MPSVTNRSQPYSHTPGGAGGVPDIVTQTLAGFNQALPGLSGNLATASGNIANQLSGAVSPDLTRTANSYFGVNSGMPGSEFIRNRGFDLYNKEGDRRRREGTQDLIGLMGGVSGIVPSGNAMLADRRAENSDALGYARLNQEGSQFDRNLAFQRWLKGQELGLSSARLGIDAAQGGAGLLGSYLNFLN